MKHHEAPPRSFNTIRHSQAGIRAKRQRQKRLVLLAVAATVLLLLLSLLSLLVASVVSAIASGSGDPNPDDGTVTPPAGEEEVLYEQVPRSNEDIHSGVLLLVNADHVYKFPTITQTNIYENRTKVNGTNIYQVVFNDYTLQKDAFTAFDDMMQKYYVLEADTSIIISSAYRSLEDQENLTSTTIRPGYSDHHTGYCVTIQEIVGDTRRAPDADHWIYQNCHKYGFIVRYPAEKSNITGVSSYENCLRYVGVPHATYMQAHGLCLEEYVELLQTAHTETPLKITGTDDKSYEVYYTVSSGEELTTLRLPKNRAYTVSGDNAGGFIVTVDMSKPIA